MAEKYIVYQYVKNKIHDCDYKKLLQRQNLSQSNKVFFNDGEMLKKWIYHLIVTLGKTRVFTLCNNNTLVHYTFFTPYCYKFGFMDRHDYVIGPCWTAEAFRGNHIYPITICNVAYQLTQKNINSHVYLLVRPDNKESTNAVLHSSGWIPVGTITKTKFKNYRTCERIEETV